MSEHHLVVTGGGRGLGLALCRAAHDAGWRVSACARRPEQVDLLVRETSAVGGVVDVRDGHGLRVWLDLAVRRNGPVSLAVSNAAILGPRTSVTEYPEAALADVISTNVNGAFLFAKAVLPHLARPGGVLMQLSSYVGRHALPNYGAYSVSKFAVEGLARLVAAEHVDDGIISVAVDPGMVVTDMLRAAVGENLPEDVLSPEVAAMRLLDLHGRLRLADSGNTVWLTPEGPGAAS